jgi:hypothetical protein
LIVFGTRVMRASFREEVHHVLNDRHTHGAAEIVVLERRRTAVLLGIRAEIPEERVGVEVVAAQEFVEASCELGTA